MNSKETKERLISSIVLVALVVLFVLTVSACSKFQDSRNLEILCEAECKDCKEVKLQCTHDWETQSDTTTKGAISGPSIK